MANQAWQISAPGELTLNDLGTIPKPGPGQVLVRIQAVSLNYRDILVTNHSPNYPIQAIQHLIPCSDGAGTVEQAGADSGWKKGERVVVHPSSWYTGTDPRSFVMDEVMGAGNVNGTLRRYMVVDDQQLVRAPEGLSIEEVSMMKTAGGSAWQALFHGRLKLEPGMSVLTQGTGGVSCWAILIAAAYGATVISTSSTDEKLEVAKKLGATHLINYRKTPDWAGQVLEATNGKGVDIVVDTVGAESVEQSLRATRLGGHIGLVGNLSTDPHLPVNVMTALLFGAKSIQGHLGHSKEMAAAVAAFVEKHQLHPPIAQVFDFDQAVEAFEAAAKLSAPGKIVVRI